IFMPFLVGTVIAPGFSGIPEKFDLTVLMTRIMFPYLLCMSLVAMLSGVLNSFRRFFFAALVPALLNVVLVGILIAALAMGIEARMTGLVLAWGVFASGLLQLALLIAGVRHQGLSLRLKPPKVT